MALQGQRLRRLQNSHLRLNHYWIESISLRSISNRREPNGNPSELSYSVAYSDPPEGVNGEHLVRLRLKTRRSARSTARYAVDMTLVGVFSFGEDKPDEEVAGRLLRYNGPAMLYGVARGIVSSLTALGSFGREDLPSANFVA